MDATCEACVRFEIGGGSCEGASELNVDNATLELYGVACTETPRALPLRILG